MILALFDVVPRLTLKVPGRTAERTHHHIPLNSDLVLNKRQWTTSLQRGHSSASNLLHLPQAQQVIPSPRHHASLHPLPLLPPRRHHPSSTITKSHLFTLGDTETRKPLTIPKWELHCQVLTLAPHHQGSDTCFQDCMDSCHPPAGAYAICELPCGLNCNLDFSHGYHYTETNLGGYPFYHEPTYM